MGVDAHPRCGAEGLESKGQENLLTNETKGKGLTDYGQGREPH
jgi:hypothetical protein